MSRRKEMDLIHVVEAVDRALDEYSADNVFVRKNEQTNMLGVYYYDMHKGFPIEDDVADYGNVDIAELEKELDERNVGYAWQD